MLVTKRQARHCITLVTKWLRRTREFRILLPLLFISGSVCCKCLHVSGRGHAAQLGLERKIFLDSCLKLKTAMLFFNILSAWCKMKIESCQGNWCSDRIISVNAWKPWLVLLQYHMVPRLEVRAYGASTAAPLFSDVIYRHQCCCYGMGLRASSASTLQRHWLLMYCVKKVDADEVVVFVWTDLQICLKKKRHQLLV